jgi:hypothetical protein
VTSYASGFWVDADSVDLTVLNHQTNSTSVSVLSTLDQLVNRSGRAI